jgi:periplasmic divalent cation tolerance protein
MKPGNADLESPWQMAYITTKDALEAKTIGRALVDKKLAACVNIFPSVVSVYRFEGKTEEAEESVLVAKTHTSCKEKLCAIVKALHSYEVPCILFYPIVGGEEAYLKWMHDSLS